MSRSVRIYEFGGPEVIRIEEVPIVVPVAGEVRLRIFAIGLNRTELTLRSGHAETRAVLPSSIGFEAAGIIDALGPGVTGFAIGEKVALVPLTVRGNIRSMETYPSLLRALSSKFLRFSILSRRRRLGLHLVQLGADLSRLAN